MKYIDKFKERGFHSTFLTSYSFSPLAFEEIVLSKLRGASCRNISVIVDKKCLNQSMKDYGAPRRAGYLYHVSKNSNFRSFHPKLVVSLGYEKGRIFAGSANLTALGLAGNKEIVAEIRYTKETTESIEIFHQVISYLKENTPEKDPWFSQSLDRAIQLTPWLNSDHEKINRVESLDYRIIANSNDTSIYQQIKDKLNGDKINKLVIISPYWDSDLSGLKHLSESINDPPIDILLESDKVLFPIGLLDKFNNKISFFEINNKFPSQFVHAKLIVAFGENWDHVISGSMNCSYSALVSGNAELGIYKRMKKGSSLIELNLNEYEKCPVNREKISSSEEKESERESEEEDSQVIEPGTFELIDSTLSWTGLNENIKYKPVRIHLFDIDGNPTGEVLNLESISQQNWRLPNECIPRTIKIEFEEKELSIQTFIIDHNALAFSTNPLKRKYTKETRYCLNYSSHEPIDLWKIIKELEAIQTKENSINTSSKNENGNESNNGNSEEPRPIRESDVYEAQKHPKSKPNYTESSGQYSSTFDDLRIFLNRLYGLFSERDQIELIDLDLQNPVNMDDIEESEMNDWETTENKEQNFPERNMGSTVPIIPKEKYKKIICKTVGEFAIHTQQDEESLDVENELIRFRAILQYVLAFSEPFDGNPRDFQVLERIGNASHEWPRMIGRIINLNFNKMKSKIKNCTLGKRMSINNTKLIEFYVLTYYSISVAINAVKVQSQPENFLLTKLESCAKNVREAVEIFLKHDRNLTNKFNSFLDEVDRRYQKLLNIDSQNLAINFDVHCTGQGQPLCLS